jgi:hypothetical protein
LQRQHTCYVHDRTCTRARRSAQSEWACYQGEYMAKYRLLTRVVSVQPMGVLPTPWFTWNFCSSVHVCMSKMFKCPCLRVPRPDRAQTVSDGNQTAVSAAMQLPTSKGTVEKQQLASASAALQPTTSTSSTNQQVTATSFPQQPRQK